MYGNPPSGAEELVQLEAALVTGVSYRVQVVASGLFDSASLEETFTP
jgi:hypothetical protein